MKREGRQHGMVRTYPNLSSFWKRRAKTRSPGGPTTGPSPRPTAGIFMKVPSKPTNHSKFTGKCGPPKCQCGDCHINPASKSKDKAKGAQRLRSSSDVVADYRLITWRVVDAGPGLKLSGFSASSALDYLAGENYDYMDGCSEAEYEECNDVNVEKSNDFSSFH